MPKSPQRDWVSSKATVIDRGRACAPTIPRGTGRLGAREATCRQTVLAGGATVFRASTPSARRPLRLLDEDSLSHARLTVRGNLSRDGPRPHSLLRETMSSSCPTDVDEYFNCNSPILELSVRGVPTLCLQGRLNGSLQEWK